MKFLFNICLQTWDYRNDKCKGMAKVEEVHNSVLLIACFHCVKHTEFSFCVTVHTGVS